MATTIIVHDADGYGLANLDQSRSRVGRFHNQAYACFLTPEGRQLNSEGSAV